MECLSKKKNNNKNQFGFKAHKTKMHKHNQKHLPEETIKQKETERKKIHGITNNIDLIYTKKKYKK